MLSIPPATPLWTRYFSLLCLTCPPPSRVILAEAAGEPVLAPTDIDGVAKIVEHWRERVDRERLDPGSDPAARHARDRLAATLDGDPLRHPEQATLGWLRGAIDLFGEPASRSGWLAADMALDLAFRRFLLTDGRVDALECWALYHGETRLSPDAVDRVAAFAARLLDRNVATVLFERLDMIVDSLAASRPASGLASPAPDAPFLFCYPDTMLAQRQAVADRLAQFDPDHLKAVDRTPRERAAALPPSKAARPARGATLDRVAETPARQTLASEAADSAPTVDYTSLANELRGAGRIGKGSPIRPRLVEVMATHDSLECNVIADKVHGDSETLGSWLSTMGSFYGILGLNNMRSQSGEVAEVDSTIGFLLASYRGAPVR